MYNFQNYHNFVPTLSVRSLKFGISKTVPSLFGFLFLFELTAFKEQKYILTIKNSLKGKKKKKLDLFQSLINLGIYLILNKLAPKLV